MRPRLRRSEREGHDALEGVSRILMREIPCVGERPVRLEREHLAIQHAAPVAAKIEAMSHDGHEVVLHEPFGDEVGLRQRAPDLLRRMRHFPLDDDGAGCARCFVH
ncbi:hypothetical protein D3C87_1675660 [compost metagenome]